MMVAHDNYTLIDHTADIGVEVRGHDFQDLLTHAGEALFGIITDLTSVQPATRTDIEIVPGENDDMLRAWLDSLLSYFNRRNMLFSRFAVKSARNGGFQGQAWGEVFDPGRHSIHTEIKGITYHQFQVRHTRRGWVARIIIDV